MAGHLCPSRKITYFTRRDARAALKRVMGAGRGDRRLRDYRCSRCGNFHLGHPPLDLVHGLITRGDL